MKLTIDTLIIKFWIHIQNLPENDIAKQCLYLSEELANRNLLSLSLRVNDLLKKYGPNLKENNTNLFSQLKLNIKKVFDDHQLMLINKNRKLNFYASFIPEKPSS